MSCIFSLADAPDRRWGTNNLRAIPCWFQQVSSGIVLGIGSDQIETWKFRSCPRTTHVELSNVVAVPCGIPDAGRCELLRLFSHKYPVRCKSLKSGLHGVSHS